MTVAVALLAYAAGAGTLGSRLLARARWAGRAPVPVAPVFPGAPVRLINHGHLRFSPSPRRPPGGRRGPCLVSSAISRNRQPTRV